MRELAVDGHDLRFDGVDVRSRIRATHYNGVFGHDHLELMSVAGSLGGNDDEQVKRLIKVEVLQILFGIKREGDGPAVFFVAIDGRGAQKSETDVFKRAEAVVTDFHAADAVHVLRVEPELETAVFVSRQFAQIVEREGFVRAFNTHRDGGHLGTVDIAARDIHRSDGVQVVQAAVIRRGSRFAEGVDHAILVDKDAARQLVRLVRQSDIIF